jgi:hypothetical protein
MTRSAPEKQVAPVAFPILPDSSDLGGEASRLTRQTIYRIKGDLSGC